MQNAILVGVRGLQLTISSHHFGLTSDKTRAISQGIVNKKPLNASRLTGNRATLTRTFTLYPEQDTKLLSAERNRKLVDKKASASQILQELIDTSLDVPTGRAKEYLTARDRSIDFEEDVLELILKAGYKAERNPKLEAKDGTRTHRADVLITGKKGKCVVELKSSAKSDRLALALSQALILKGESGLPTAVCVPLLVDSAFNEIYQMSNIGLLEAGDLLAWIKTTVG